MNIKKGVKVKPTTTLLATPAITPRDVCTVKAVKFLAGRYFLTVVGPLGQPATMATEHFREV